MNHDETITKILDSIAKEYNYESASIEPSKEIDSERLKPLWIDITLKMSLKDEV